MENRFRENFLAALKRPASTVPFTLILGTVVIPLLHGLGHLTWDESVVAILVPIVIGLAFATLCVGTISPDRRAEMEREHASNRAHEGVPIPADIGMALVLLVLTVISELLLLASTLVYWLLQVPFVPMALRIDIGVAKVAFYIVAYIGASLCWRWCLPRIRYESYSLFATVLEASHPVHRRTRAMVR